MITDNECFLHAAGPEPVMAVVRELRAMGLVQGIDFDFRYQPLTHDQFDYSILVRKGAWFAFKDAKWATMFRIKHGSI